MPGEFFASVAIAMARMRHGCIIISIWPPLISLRTQLSCSLFYLDATGDLSLSQSGSPSLGLASLRGSDIDWLKLVRAVFLMGTPITACENISTLHSCVLLCQSKVHWNREGYDEPMTDHRSNEFFSQELGKLAT